MMNSTALSAECNTGRIGKTHVLEASKEETRAVARTEHDELGETVFYDLSPVHMSLYYAAFDPDMNIS